MALKSLTTGLLATAMVMAAISSTTTSAQEHPLDHSNFNYPPVGLVLATSNSSSSNGSDSQGFAKCKYDSDCQKLNPGSAYTKLCGCPSNAVKLDCATFNRGLSEWVFTNGVCYKFSNNFGDTCTGNTDSTTGQTIDFQGSCSDGEACLQQTKPVRRLVCSKVTGKLEAEGNDSTTDTPSEGSTDEPSDEPTTAADDGETTTRTPTTRRPTTDPASSTTSEPAANDESGTATTAASLTTTKPPSSSASSLFASAGGLVFSLAAALTAVAFA